MTVTFREQIAALSVSERVLLVEDIWDSVASEARPDDGISETQLLELSRRVEKYQNAPDMGKSWKTVRENLQRRL